MVRFAASLVAAFTLAACASSGALRALRTEPADFVHVVEAHNTVRAKLRPSPVPPLSALTWSPGAAAVAAKWAERCRFRHNSRRGNFGENLFAMSHREPDDIVIAAAVRSWASEAADYDYAKNDCLPGAICGHYTQMVWRDTRAVGCALARCDGGSPFGGGPWTLLVCNYDPPGNFVGRRPY